MSTVETSSKNDAKPWALNPDKIGKQLYIRLLSNETAEMQPLIKQVENDDKALDTVVNSTHGRFKRPLIVIAAEKNNLTAVELLLKHKAGVNHTDKTNWTALHQACKHGNLQMVETLMKNGGDPNIVAKDKDEQTCMMLAALSGNVDVIKCLINANKEYKHSFDWVCIYLCYMTTDYA